MHRNIQELYNLPEEVVFCKKCTVSNQRPRITFNEEGVCSACQYAEYKRKEIDWEQREKELIALCEKHRKNNGLERCNTTYLRKETNTSIQKNGSCHYCK